MFNKRNHDAEIIHAAMDGIPSNRVKSVEITWTLIEFGNDRSGEGSVIKPNIKVECYPDIGE